MQVTNTAFHSMVVEINTDIPIPEDAGGGVLRANVFRPLDTEEGKRHPVLMTLGPCSFFLSPILCLHNDIDLSFLQTAKTYHTRTFIPVALQTFTRNISLNFLSGRLRSLVCPQPHCFSRVLSP